MSRGYTAEQHKANRVAAAYGYKISEGVALSEFEVGDGIIVLNKKGEPMNSGLIIDIQQTVMGYLEARVGDYWYCESEFSFRKL